jgi:hypothetical protein
MTMGSTTTNWRDLEGEVIYKEWKEGHQVRLLSSFVTLFYFLWPTVIPKSNAIDMHAALMMTYIPPESLFTFSAHGFPQ